MSEKLKPANRILDALLSEHGRAEPLDEAARVAVELHDPHGHDLHRLADDGCPHHLDDGSDCPHRDALWSARYLDLRRQGYTDKGATEMADQGIPHDPQPGEALPVVIQKSDHDLDAVRAEAIERRNRGPFGKSPLLAAEYGPHLPTGAKERKAIPLCTGVLDYFPDALAAVAEVSRIGNEQHNPGQPLHWAKGKSTDHADCALRHFAERYEVDTDGGLHGAKAAWRMLADLQISIEAKRAGMSYADYIARLKAQEAA